MGYITKVQRVDRPTNQSFYVIVPAALAQSFDMDKGEEFEWSTSSLRPVLTLVHLCRINQDSHYSIFLRKITSSPTQQ
jgi:hypothetical protein